MSNGLPTVKHEGVQYRFTVQQWQFSPDEAQTIGLKAKLWTAEEAAEQPEMIAHLINTGSSLMKKI